MTKEKLNPFNLYKGFFIFLYILTNLFKKNNMTHTTTQATTKPKFWVTMTDRFMSGWGMAAGKTNKLVIACDTYEQAESIERNANKRSEMKYVNICSTKPYYRSNVLVSNKHYSDMGEIWTKK